MTGKFAAATFEGHAVTAKDLMVQPNPPRFLREGDTIEFTAKISNQSEAVQRGTVRLTFNDSLTAQSADKLIGNNRPEQSFDIPAKQSRTVAWRIQIPELAVSSLIKLWRHHRRLRWRRRRLTGVVTPGSS